MRYGRMWRFDGLESLQYTTLNREKRQLFKWILVDFDAYLLKEVQMIKFYIYFNFIIQDV